jgi:Ca2+-binding RTX toxin-like protein
LQVNGTAAADSITVTSTQVSRGLESVHYQQIEDLEVTGGTGDDELHVLSTSIAGARLDAEDGSDDYLVNFGSLAGAVEVDDSGAFTDTDTLLVNGTGSDDDLVLGASSITRGAETVSYLGIEELTLDAGAGDDTITVNGTGAETTVLGGDGDDHFIVNANGAFTLTLDGEEGSDLYEINLGALAGPVVIDDTGTTGTDTLLVNGTPFDDVIVLTDTSISGLGDGSPIDLTFSGIEVLAVDAKAGDDVVDGSALTISVTIYGGDGDDLLIGGSNDDQIFGQGDNDDIIGNLGSDLLDGGAGSDGILGDMGTIVRELVAGGGLATLLTTQNGKLEAFIDRPGTIRRKVTLANAGEGGNDTLIGGTGDDYLHGGAGDDDLAGDDGIDALFGNDGNDALAGGADDDHLYGGAGDDELDGNAGADIAYGGDGSDRLVADSSGDRLIDWFGNFNEFVVPGPGFGAPVIVRSPAPWVHDFLFVLAADDGSTDAEAELGYVSPGGGLQQANSGKGS